MMETSIASIADTATLVAMAEPPNMKTPASDK
jgi:hypothetical protein